MSKQLRIEDPNAAFLIVTRTHAATLCSNNDRDSEERILSQLAKYQEIHQVIIYAFCCQKNCYLLLARFPHANKSVFLRDFNASVAKAFKYDQPLTVAHGKFWKDRLADWVLPTTADITHWVLQAAAIEDGYNSFQEATHGARRLCKLIDRSDYNNRKRYNQSLTVEDCTRSYTLHFQKVTEEPYRRGSSPHAPNIEMLIKSARDQGLVTASRGKRNTPVVFSLEPNARREYEDRLRLTISSSKSTPTNYGTAEQSGVLTKSEAVLLTQLKKVNGS